MLVIASLLEFTVFIIGKSIILVITSFVKSIVFITCKNIMSVITPFVEFTGFHHMHTHHVSDRFVCRIQSFITCKSIMLVIIPFVEFKVVITFNVLRNM